MASYIDVASKQGIAIEQVDFMYQQLVNGEYTPSLHSIGSAGATSATGVQLTDVNRGVNIISAADRALVGSGTLVQDNVGGLSHTSDLYPDNYGPVATDEARIVVNDQLFLTAATDNNFNGSGDMAVTVRVKCRIVKLTERDFMAIAITSSAADN
mgnify:FL=1